MCASTPNTGAESGRLFVAVGVISDPSGRILLSQRHGHCPYAGLWEFPGGKREYGESRYQALVRELREELAITVQDAHPLISMPFDYPDRSVFLDVWRVTAYQGEPRGVEGQPLTWVKPDAFESLPLLPANDAVVRSIRLAPIYPISSIEQFGLETTLQGIGQAFRAGTGLVQIREKALSREALADLLKKIRQRCGKGQILINAAPEWVQAVGADGVHLDSRRLLALKRRPLAASKWVAASCHSAHELQHAAQIECDFAVLSPVKPTRSHPGQTPLGWQQFEKLVQDCAMPIYGLGGLNLADLDAARYAGAQGLAMIGGFWQQL